DKAAVARWSGDGARAAAASAAGWGKHCLFVLSTGAETIVAADVRTAGMASSRADAGVEVVDAALLCVVGPEAGTAEIAGAAAEAVLDAGGEMIAMCASGRSSVLAVRRDNSGDLLRALHSLFFTPRPHCA
ncbi:MAG: hypothetical protein JXB46_08290, partial [Candidatus Eisenbacteria bacterium]|nr:hypothetical protein [Candidatus Eisenbacteria bacterium]